jgi:hypothetical protein
MPPVKINEKNYSRSIKKYINNPKRSSPRNLRWVNVKSAGRITELEQSSPTWLIGSGEVLPEYDDFIDFILP